MPTGADVEEPDPQVVAAARRGDLGAFETLVRRYQAEVWRLARRLVRDPTAADDVTQDAFLRAFRGLPRYRGESKFSTWLFAIARNCAHDELRRAGRRNSLSERLDRERARDQPAPGEAIEVREAVERLPLEAREAIVLIDMLGASYSDASVILDVPVGTVKSRVHRAREQLAHALLIDRKRTTRDAR